MKTKHWNLNMTFFNFQVKVLELETQLENERLRLGELRKKHYGVAGVPLEEVSEGNGDTSLVQPGRLVTMSPKPSKPALSKKPAFGQKPNIPPKNMVSVHFQWMKL